MNTYNATARVNVSSYMSEDDDTQISVNFTVSASSEEEAKEKVHSYFSKRNESYATHYDVRNVDIWTHLE